MEAQGSVLTNKYAEGYPGKTLLWRLWKCWCYRNISYWTCKTVRSAEHANVTTSLWFSSKLGVYFALLQPGDTIVGMNLSLVVITHGSPVNVSGTYFNVVPYGVDAETQQIDYDEFRKIVLEAKPNWSSLVVVLIAVKSTSKNGWCSSWSWCYLHGRYGSTLLVL